VLVLQKLDIQIAFGRPCGADDVVRAAGRGGWAKLLEDAKKCRATPPARFEKGLMRCEARSLTLVSSAEINRAHRSRLCLERRGNDAIGHGDRDAGGEANRSAFDERHVRKVGKAVRRPRFYREFRAQE